MPVTASQPHHLISLLSLHDDADATDGDNTADRLDLGELDITTTHFDLERVGQEIEQFADHEVLKAILDQGCDPKEYSRQYEAKLRQAELESIQDYITESDNLVKLHEQISSCDNILANMEEMLGKFQSDLGNISSEIRYLQEQSQTMSIKLRNRKATQEKLGGFIENIAIPASLITGIVQGEVDDAFIPQLELLHTKLEFVETNAIAQSSAAYRDVAPELEKLRVKAVAKSRDYLMQKIYALRKPKTNIQILQQNVLLKYKYLVTFLRQHGREVFEEIRVAYIDTLSRVLSSYFRAYLTAMEKLQVVDVPTPQDLLGNSDTGSAGSSMMAMFTRTSASHHKADIFGIKDRATLLQQVDTPAIIPHIAEAHNAKFQYEVLFRSVNKLLLDTATAEFLFCQQFFSGDATVFAAVFSPTLAVMEGQLSAQLQEMYDMIALLLMIRINDKHRELMSARGIQCLDDYLDRINLLLWPRLKALFDLQYGSVRAFNITQHPWTELKLHYVTERYAHLTAAMITINADARDSPLDSNIERMKTAVIELLLRISRGYSKKKQSTIFLILNLTFILTVIKDAVSRMVSGGGSGTPPSATPLAHMATSIIKEFEDQLLSCSGLYVEEVLAEHFSRLIMFVKKADTALKMKGAGAESGPIAGYGPSEAAPIVKEFSAKWTSAIDSLHKEVMKEFSSSSAAGREVLKAAMTQLLLYYTRLLELLKKCGPEGAALLRDAVTVPSIMYEIKRYNRG